MFKNRIITGCAALAIVTNMSFAGTMGVVESCPDLSLMPWFLEFGSGASWSNTAHIRTDPSRWNASPNGYNSSLDTVPLYTAGIGYTMGPLISIDAAYTFRGSYKYNKHQIAEESNVQNPLGDRTRYFNLDSNSLVFSGTLHGRGWSDKLAYDLGNCAFIEPIIGGGIGVSYNTISNFHTVLDDNLGVTSAMQDLSTVSFAWQVNAALEWKKDRFSVDLGYRYFDAGRFHSNHALINRLDSSGTPIMTNTIPAWSSRLSANELFVTAKVAF